MSSPTEPTPRTQPSVPAGLRILLPPALFALLAGLIWGTLYALGSPLATQNAFIAALAGGTLVVTILATILIAFLRKRYTLWQEQTWQVAFQDAVTRPMGIQHIYNTLEDAQADIVRDIEKAKSIRLFVQLGRYMLAGAHSLLYDALAKRSGDPVSVRVLHAAKESPFLSRDRLRKRGSNAQAILTDIDHLKQQLLSLRDEVGVQVEARQHCEPYLWRLLFFDDVAYVSGYLYDKDNDKLAFVYRIVDGPKSLYKIFDKYFEYLWEKYPPTSGTLQELIPQSALSSAALLIRRQGKNLFMVFDRPHDADGKVMYRFAGIGGKRNATEQWHECALREAREETGATVTIASAPSAVYLDLAKDVRPLTISSDPCPIALLETPDEASGLRSGWGKRYTVVYMASVTGQLRNRSEIRGFLTVSDDLLLHMYRHETTFEACLDLGGEFLGNKLPKGAILQPYGTAELLSICLAARHQSIRPLLGLDTA